MRSEVIARIREIRSKGGEPKKIFKLRDEFEYLLNSEVDYLNQVAKDWYDRTGRYYQYEVGISASYEQREDPEGKSMWKKYRSNKKNYPYFMKW